MQHLLLSTAWGSLPLAGLSNSCPQHGIFEYLRLAVGQGHDLQIGKRGFLQAKIS